MKIAILYICTGKYDIFWPEFYKTCQHYFCSNQHKDYFVFTDSTRIKQAQNVRVIYQDNLGWPFNTLYRYRMFLREKSQLVDYDYIVFFNANALFIEEIHQKDFLGDDKELVAAIHPGYINRAKTDYPYEKRSLSLACVSQTHGYFQGAINGGKASTFLALAEQLSSNIEKDLDNGIMAVWHDESYWNAYINNHYAQLKLHVLPAAYLYPEGWKLPFAPKIIMRDKNKYGGHLLLRGVNSTLIQKIKLKLLTLIKTLLLLR